MVRFLTMLTLATAGTANAALMPVFSFAGNAAPVGGGQYDADTSFGATSDAALEVFLGLATGSLDALSPSGNDATEGSAILVSVGVEAGDKVSFDWMFSTDENPNDPVCPAAQCRDFAFFSAALTTADGLFLLADALDDNAGASGSVMLEASGAGTLELGIGVMDANDTLIASFISAKNFVFTDINPPSTGMPLPSTLVLVALGLLAMRRRRNVAR
jgi:hypothetical protein